MNVLFLLYIGKHDVVKIKSIFTKKISILCTGNNIEIGEHLASTSLSLTCTFRRINQFT